MNLVVYFCGINSIVLCVSIKMLGHGNVLFAVLFKHMKIMDVCLCACMKDSEGQIPQAQHSNVINEAAVELNCILFTCE